MKNLGIFAPFWDTILELADSKKAMIFLLGMIALSQAEQLGFEGVKADYRLAAAVFLMSVWMLSQAAVDIWASCKEPKIPPTEPPKTAS
jgi:hypothetical protein